MALFLGCQQGDKSNKTLQTVDPVADSIRAFNMAKVAEADSLAKLHKTFTGTHQHGKDLAKHAHQNLPKKRYMRKKALAVHASRMAAQQQEEERRNARIMALLGTKEK